MFVHCYRNRLSDAFQSGGLHWGYDTCEAVGLPHRFDPFVTGLLKLK